MESNLRLRILLIIIIVISFVMAARVIYLSFQKPDDYIISNDTEYSIKRGDIFDRNGTLLAVSDELQSVYANPKSIKSIDKTSKDLAKVLNISEKDIYEKLKENRNFVWIKRQITPQEANLIGSLNTEGIGLKMEYKRFYPNKNLSSHILGFCNIDSHGIEGIEKSMDKYLAPSNDDLFDKTNKNINGNNVILTIDANIQAISDKVLKEALINERADYVSMVLLDGKTGEILCLSNSPDYDPNKYSEYNQKYFRNSVIFDQFEPGSILKVFAVSALLDKKLIDKTDHFFCNGSYTRNNVTVECPGVHGVINYYGIIKYSCNAGMLEAAERIKPQDLYNYLKSFGFSMRTSVELPGEQPGFLRDIKEWSPRSMYAIPIGQEISVNALQVARASTTFINDGVMIEPYIVKKIFDEKNKLIYDGKRKEVRRVLSQGISQEIIEAMKSSTERGGTNYRLNIEGIDFAAKSGTGQIYDYETKKYSSTEFTSSLLVIFPAYNPRYILYVVFQKPRGTVKWGGVIGSKLINDFLGMLTGYLDMTQDKGVFLRINM